MTLSEEQRGELAEWVTEAERCLPTAGPDEHTELRMIAGLADHLAEAEGLARQLAVALDRHAEHKRLTDLSWDADSTVEEQDLLNRANAMLRGMWQQTAQLLATPAVQALLKEGKG
jgi:hypothetical protein